MGSENVYTVEDGAYLIDLSRSAIKTYLEEGQLIKTPGNSPKKLTKKAGIFVTLETYPEKDLRGCIGYPEPILPLVEAAIRAAVSAATDDPRFPPVMQGELENTLMEVSLLTPPELIKVNSPKEYLSLIKIGQHGLIVEKGFHRGLLLPQVPVDQGWEFDEFISHTCMKAGLSPDSWFDGETSIYRFEGRVFAELKPAGQVEERKLQ